MLRMHILCSLADHDRWPDIEYRILLVYFARCCGSVL
jgi:hypothetical protein